MNDRMKEREVWVQNGSPHGLADAIERFRDDLPGWWFSVGECSVSADASCGPDRQGSDAHLLTDRLFDGGFHADLPQPASMADALDTVRRWALKARGDHQESG